MINSLKILLVETFKNYPKLFVILVFSLIFETLILISSVITIIPLVDYMLDPSLSDPNQYTKIVLRFLDYFSIDKNYFVFGFYLFLRMFFALFWDLTFKNYPKY